MFSTHRCKTCGRWGPAKKLVLTALPDGIEKQVCIDCYMEIEADEIEGTPI